MKKAILILILPFIALSLFAVTFSSIGMSGLYNQGFNYGELGFYENLSVAYPIEDTPVNIGFGERLDLSFSIPVDTLSIGFITGFTVNANLTSRWDLNLLIGPDIIVSSGDTDSLIGFGGAFDLSFTYYLNSDRSIGMTIGSINYFNAGAMDSYRGYKFTYYGGGYLGLTVRFSAPPLLPLPLGYDYIDMVDAMLN